MATYCESQSVAWASGCRTNESSSVVVVRDPEARSRFEIHLRQPIMALQAARPDGVVLPAGRLALSCLRGVERDARGQ